MRLYRFEAKIVVYVLGVDGADAEDVAAWRMAEHIEESGVPRHGRTLREVRSARDVEPAWLNRRPLARQRSDGPTCGVLASQAASGLALE